MAATQLLIVSYSNDQSNNTKTRFNFSKILPTGLIFYFFKYPSGKHALHTVTLPTDSYFHTEKVAHNRYNFIQEGMDFIGIFYINTFTLDDTTISDRFNNTSHEYAYKNVKISKAKTSIVEPGACIYSIFNYLNIVRKYLLSSDRYTYTLSIL